LLGVDVSSSVAVNGLTEEDVRLVHALVRHLREKNDSISTL
jgi:hypothetical protein